MIKKILYAIVILAVIIILSIMWSDSKKEEILPTIPPVTIDENINAPESEPSISDELDSINIDSGIDADIEAVDTEIKTL